MMNGTSYKKKSVTAAVFVVASLAILGGGGWFLTSQIISSSAQLTEQKGMLEATQINWDQITRSQKELQSIKPELARIDEAFVPKDQPIEFINLLESLAQRTHNLFEISLTTGDVKKKEDGLFFQVRLTGSFSNLMHFLNYLQNMKYRVQVRTLDINAYGGGGSTGGTEVPARSVYSVIDLKALTN